MGCQTGANPERFSNMQIKSDSAAMNIPAGWKLVPLEPNKEMLYALNTVYESAQRRGYWNAWNALWKAMLDAAPAPPIVRSMKK
jgi:hypothetical protein